MHILVKKTDNILSRCGTKIYSAGLKNKIENNSTWKRAFYQSEWDIINSSWVIFIFSLYDVAANATELFYVSHLVNIEGFLYHSNRSFWISIFICM